MPTVLDFKQAYLTAFVKNQQLLHWGGERVDLQRTTCMQAYIYPSIADILSMSLLYEYKNIDAIFSPQTNSPNAPFSQDDVPRITPRDNVTHIAVEHENNSDKYIRAELEKFATSGYPLNVLITYITSTEARERIIFDKPDYKPFFDRLRGRLLVIIDNDMYGLWDMGKRNIGDPLYWSFFFLDSNGRWVNL